MRVSAKNSSGSVLSNLDTVVPVSDEMHCANCHTPAAWRPTTPPRANMASRPGARHYPAIQVMQNVLILHDAMNQTTLMANQPVLCASCHYSRLWTWVTRAPGRPDRSQVPVPGHAPTPLA